MSSAEAPASTTASLSGIVGRLRESPRIGLIVGVAFAVTVLVALLLWSRSPDYDVLYSGLSDRDGGAVVSRLDQMKVPYQLSAGGSTIRVPAGQVDHLRLQLASDGLPKGGDVGFELMDNQPFGISEFAEQVNYQRALDGELERSISTIAEVASARVQLAIPKKSIFVSQRQQPKASVVLDLYHGRALSPGQVTAIQHLVASAVPDLPADSVTIVDSSGHLLSGHAGEGDDVDGQRLAYTKRVEQIYQQRIQSLLQPVVGSSNLRAEVVASLDFSHREQTQESYAPNNGDKPAAIRSQQSHNDVRRKDSDDGGIPGALSNQPTPDAASPINNPTSQKGAGQSKTTGGSDAQSGSELSNSSALGLSDAKYVSTTRNETTNYELNKTIAHVTDPTGQIQQLSVAVVINQNAFGGTKKNGGANPAGLSKARMEQIRDLVKNAIGFRSDRGDSIQVMQMPFSAPVDDTDTGTSPSWWQNPGWQALIIKTLKYLGLAIVAWLLWRRLVKPLAERSGLLGNGAAPATAAQPRIAQTEGESEAEINAAAAREARRRRYDDAVGTSRAAAEKDPDMVATILKQWMKNDA